MTKRFNLLILLICIIAVVSFCTLPLFAEETTATEIGSQTTENDPSQADPIVKTVEKIELNATKTDYLALDLLDTSALSALIVYTDGTSEPLDLSLCDIYPAIDTPLSASLKNISISYSIGENNIFTASAEINVAPILSVDAEGLDAITLYEAQPMDAVLNSITLKAYYDDAKTVSKIINQGDFDLLSDLQFVKPDANGKCSFSIVADTYSHDLSLDVSIITGYSVSGLKATYYYGDALTKSDVKVTALYADSHSFDVTEQVIITAPEIIIAGSTLTITHNDKDLKEYINTKFPQGTLVIISNPTKTVYEVGESFVSAGLDVVIKYSDNERKFLTSTDYTIRASDPLTTADKYVTIDYYGATENIPITVGNEAYIVYLTIIGFPEKLTYTEGDLLDINGLIIEARLSDGTKITVDPSTLTFTPALSSPLTSDLTAVIISANNGTDNYCFTELPVAVNRKTPTALVGTTKPLKLEYKEGECFDPEGLTLSLILIDGSVTTPASFSFSPSLDTPFVLTSNKTQKVIVYTVYEYEGGELTYPIEVTVKPAEVDNIIIMHEPDKKTYAVGEKFDPTGLELFLIYKDRTLTPQQVPADSYTFKPTVIKEDTKEIIIEFRGLTVKLPITVLNDNTTEESTVPPITDNTTEGTTDSGDMTNDNTTDITTEDTSKEQTTDIPVFTYPDSSEDTLDIIGDNKSSISPILYLWIAIISIIVIALVILIIYYKRNFT